MIRTASFGVRLKFVVRLKMDFPAEEICDLLSGSGNGLIPREGLLIMGQMWMYFSLFYFFTIIG